MHFKICEGKSFRTGILVGGWRRIVSKRRLKKKERKNTLKKPCVHTLND